MVTALAGDSVGRDRWAGQDGLWAVGRASFWAAKRPPREIAAPFGMEVVYPGMGGRTRRRHTGGQTGTIGGKGYRCEERRRPTGLDRTLGKVHIMRASSL